jgi:hypothetical protein
MIFSSFSLRGHSDRVSHINVCVNPFKDEEVLLNPITQSKVLNIHVTGAWGWLLSISHGGTGTIILVGDCGCFLWNV